MHVQFSKMNSGIQYDCARNLTELQVLLQALDAELYTRPLRVLSQASIGQHCRHVIELYRCLLSGMASGEVSYDSRRRDALLENNLQAALTAIDDTIHLLNVQHHDTPLRLSSNIGPAEVQGECIHSSLNRELLYNLEHCIHHQALIKAGLTELNLVHLVQPGFGVAPSTLRYREQLRQQNAGA